MPFRPTRKAMTVAALGTTQTLAWASSYYLPAILAEPITAGLHVSKPAFFGFFSASLLLQAALGPAIGRAIDRRGGRGVLMLSNLVLAAGLVWLGLVQGVIGLAGAWLVLGIGMAMGLYDPAFAALTALYGREARSAITGITLIAGFASTVGWPLSAWLNHAFGWRGACLGWSALNLVVCLPINRFLIPLPAAARPDAMPAPETPVPANGMAALAFVFGAVGFVTGAMAAHLPGLLELAGASVTAAIAASALMGPAQVAARLFEFGVLKRMHGLLTISRGTLPLALFGPAGYGRRTGIIVAPARVTTAAAPLLFGLMMSRLGLGALLVSAGLSLAALGVLALLRVQPVGASARGA